MSNFATTVLEAASLFENFLKMCVLKNKEIYVPSVIFPYARMAPRLGLEPAIKHCT